MHTAFHTVTGAAKKGWQQRQHSCLYIYAYRRVRETRCLPNLPVFMFLYFQCCFVATGREALKIKGLSGNKECCFLLPLLPLRFSFSRIPGNILRKNVAACCRECCRCQGREKPLHFPYGPNRRGDPMGSHPICVSTSFISALAFLVIIASE